MAQWMAHNKGHSQIFNQQVEAKKVVYSEDKKISWNTGI